MHQDGHHGDDQDQGRQEEDEAGDVLLDFLPAFDGGGGEDLAMGQAERLPVTQADQAELLQPGQLLDRGGQPPPGRILRSLAAAADGPGIDVVDMTRPPGGRRGAARAGAARRVARDLPVQRRRMTIAEAGRFVLEQAVDRGRQRRISRVPLSRPTFGRCPERAGERSGVPLSLRERVGERGNWAHIGASRT